MRGEKMKNNQFSILGAGFHCVDIIEQKDHKQIALGGTAANVLTILSKLGQKVTFISADYDNIWGEWLRASLIARNITVYPFSKSRMPAPRVIEVLDEKAGEHHFQTICPVCGKSLPKVVLPNEAHIKEELIQQAEQANVFFYDRISPGIKKIAASNKSGWNFFEPNSCRNYQVLLDALKEVNILKFSQSRIPRIYTEQMMDDLQGSKVQLIIITMGADGFRFSFREKQGLFSDWIMIQPQKTGKVIDDSGAGDWLSAIFIYYFLQQYPIFSDKLDEKLLTNMLNEAKKIAALKCSFIGAQGIFQNQVALKVLENKLNTNISLIHEIDLEWGNGCFCCGRL